MLARNYKQLLVLPLTLETSITTKRKVRSIWNERSTAEPLFLMDFGSPVPTSGRITMYTLP